MPHGSSGDTIPNSEKLGMVSPELSVTVRVREPSGISTCRPPYTFPPSDTFPPSRDTFPPSQ